MIHTRKLYLTNLDQRTIMLSIIIVLFLNLKCVYGTPCTSHDCIVSDWEHWSQCSESCGEEGITTRTRQILQEESCGGSCSLNTTESVECNRWCCAQDCILTSWSNWMDCMCSRECDNITQRSRCIRSRSIASIAKCGGYCSSTLYERKCGNLCCYRDCVEGGWSAWGQCVGQCEQIGVKTRKKVVLQNPSCGGTPCSEAMEEAECTGGCCPVHCSVGQWTEWSVCNSTCGNGHQYRSRVVNEATCGGNRCADPSELQLNSCSNYVNIDCVVSAWTGWLSCKLHNGICGKGMRNRSRTIVTWDSCKGSECPELSQTSECSGPCCLVNCEVTPWTGWDPCSTDCGEGISSRTREITIASACGGTPCPELLEKMPCRRDEVVNCSLTEWSVWPECSNDCGAGTSVRSRTLLTPAYCGGAPCLTLPLDDARDCESYRARQDCQVDDWANWEPCIRNCEEGIQIRRRDVKVPQFCGGMACPRTTDVRTCHKKCTQNCNQGVCSCQTGYYLSTDGVLCYPVQCSHPYVQYCPPTHKFLSSCKYPKLNCFSYSYGSQCTASCERYANWELKGSPTYVTCLEDGKWSQAPIFCAPANTPPTKLNIDNTDIVENSPIGTIVAYMTTEDVDFFDKHTYTIVNDPTNRFTIKEHRVLLQTKPDYEDPPTRWNVTFRSQDIDGQYVEDTFEFRIINRNDPPSSVTLSPDSILENSPFGTHIGCFSGRDDESGTNVTILLVDTNHNKFELYERNSEKCLKVAAKSDSRCSHNGGKYCVLNREKRRKLMVTVLATDTGNPPEFVYFDIPVHLEDINDRPATILLNPQSVPENVQPGESLAELQTDDEDSHDTFTYELLKNDGGLFSLSGHSIVSKKMFDFEEQKALEFEIQVKSTDNGTPPLSITSTVRFKVGDVNEKPYDVQLKSYNGQLSFEDNKPRVRENTKAAMVGTVFVSDVDEGDNVTLTLPQDANGRLAIQQQRCFPSEDVNVFCTATLAMVGEFDYEVEPYVNISIQAGDREGLQTSVELTLSVVDRNDQPQDILVDDESVSDLYVPENDNHYVVGKLTAVDEDQEDSHTFYLTESAGRKFVILDNILMTYNAANLDYEDIKDYEIKILVEDRGVPRMFYEKTFNVHVDDVNEAPTALMLSNTQITENSADGTVVGRLSTTDPDNARVSTQNCTYILLVDPHGHFIIEGDVLKVSLSSATCGSRPCALDFESASSVAVEINATDSGTPPLFFSKVFTIDITDANDPPHTVRLSASSMRENSPNGTQIGIINAIEEDVGQVVSYELLDSTDLFELTDDSALITKASFDQETIPTYNITVRATDNGVPPISVNATITVDILNINEAPQYAGEVVFEADENSAIGTAIGIIEVADPDYDDIVTYTITGIKGVFQITGVACQKEEGTGTVCTGNLTLVEGLDYVKMPEYSIQVTAQDRGGLTMTQTIQVMVTDTNNPPTNLLIDGRSVSTIPVEENLEDISIGVLSAVDTDEGQNFTYSLVSIGSGPFEINGNNLRVQQNATLDYESMDEYALEINVTDDGVPPRSLSKLVSIHVVDVNEAPSKLSITNTQIPENSGEGDVVGILQVEDPDNAKVSQQGFTFTLVDNAGGRFMVKGSELQVAKPNAECLQLGGGMCYMNFEDSSNHHVKVLVTDTGVPSGSKLFELDVQVLDMNDSPRNVQINNYKVEALAPSGEVVGRLTVDDEDGYQTHVFSLVDDSNGLFGVSPDGVLTKVTDQDLDIRILYVVKISATDNGTTPMRTEETFTITAVIEETTRLTLNFTSEGSGGTFVDGSPTVLENSADDTVVGTLIATDERPDQDLTFKVTCQLGAVKLDSTTNCENKDGGTVCVVRVLTAVELDHETTPSVHMVVQVNGDGNQSFAHVFTLTVKNVNEQPEDISYDGDRIFVQENLNGEVFGLFVGKDPDIKDILSFSLTDDGGGKFTITEDGRLSTTEDASIDFEETPRIDITVAVQDAGGLGIHESYMIDISDVNEHPNNITLSDNEVPEMAVKGTHIGVLSAVDPDQGQTTTFILQDDAEGRFWIDRNVLKVNDPGSLCGERGGVLCLLDYESKSSHDIVVKASDDGFPPRSSTDKLTVDVTDVNDPPKDLTLTLVNVREDINIGDVVGKLNVFDEDKDSQLVYSITSGDDEHVFETDGADIRLQKQLDFENTPTYNLTIEVTDDGNPPETMSNVFTLDVIDANEGPDVPTFEPKAGESGDFSTNKPIIQENRDFNSLIGQIVAMDPDDNDMLIFTTTNKDVNLFNQDCWPLRKGVRCSCDVRTAVVFDYETQPTVDVKVMVSDKQGLTSSAAVTLSIVDVNDPPTDILMNNQSVSSLFVAEDTTETTLASLKTIDVDVNQMYTYSILTSTNAFFIVGDAMQISAQSLDYELHPTHELVVRVTDNGDPPLYLDKVLTVQVTDVNEAPRDITLSTNQVPEDSPVGFEIGTLITDDPDNTRTQDQKFTYTLKESVDGRFVLDGAVLKVEKSDFDYESTRSYLVTVVATDTGSPPMSIEATIKLRVTDANDSPRDLQLSGGVVTENSKVGTVVGVFLATDEDINQRLSYFLLPNDFFTVVGDELVVDGAIDFERTPYLTVEVLAMDDGTPPASVSQNVTLRVVNINEAPVNITFLPSEEAVNMTIPEDLVVGGRIGSIIVTDPDHQDMISVRMTNNSDDIFEVSRKPVCQHTPSLGYYFTECEFILTLTQNLNYEENQENITLELEATDMFGETITYAWIFSIRNSNEPPSNITIDGGLSAIPENLPYFLIGALNSEDEDADDDHMYQVITNWDMFRIHGNKLYVTIPLDFEKTPSITVSINSIDTGLPPQSFVREFVFEVENVNEQPSDILLSHTEVSNAATPGDVVGFVTVMDPDNAGLDAPIQDHICTVGGNAFGYFVVEKTTTQTLKVAKDIPKDTFEMVLRLTCKDDGDPSLSLTVYITLTINETIVIQKGVLLNNQREVPENSDTNVIVGELQVVNLLTEEAVGGSYTFSLTDEGLPFRVNGVNLETTKPLDSERQTKWTVGILTTGVDTQNRNVNITSQFTVDVLDVNEVPYKINVYGGGMVTENSLSGTVIGDLNSQDHELDQTYNYTIMAVSPGLDISQARDDSMDAFALDGKTLVVGKNFKAFNYEIVNYFSLLIQTTDSGSPPLSYNGTIHIIIQNTNDAPTDIHLTHSTVRENSAVDTLVGEIGLVDEDTEQTYTCQVTKSKDVPFKVENGSRLVTSGTGLDYESIRVYTVEIQCTDQGQDINGLSISKAFVVNVTNVNEPPIGIKITQKELYENNKKGQVIGEIQVIDPDSIKTDITLVDSDGSSVFSVEGDNTLVTNEVLDFESKAEHTIVIRATDVDGLWTEEHFTIKILDVNEPPSAILLDRRVVDEKTAPGYIVGTLTTVDEDVGQTFKYTMLKNATTSGGQDYFEIKEDKLITGPEPLDHEMQSQYTLVIRSLDSGTPVHSIEMEITIEVKNVNEEPEDIIVSTFPLTLSEDVVPPFVVTSVEVDDPDVGQHHICQVEQSSGPFIIKTFADHRMELILNGALDFETKDTYDVVVRCSDGFLEKKKAVVVAVSDVNEPPEMIRLGGTGTITAGASPGTVIGTLTVQDPDNGQKHTYTIIGPNSDLIQIEGDNIVLASVIPDDIVYSEHPVVMINITATDNGIPTSLSVQQVFTIVITDVEVLDRPLPAIIFRKADVFEDWVSGKVIGSLFSGNSSNQHIEVKIVDNPYQAFVISNRTYLMLNTSLLDVQEDVLILNIEVRNKETFQSASTEVVITIRRIDKCQRPDNQTCAVNARCVEVNGTLFDCECEVGYTGDGYICTRETYCDVSPCQNGGQCVDGVDAATCLCQGTYTGSLCEVSNKIDNPCLKNPCKNGGMCAINVGKPSGFDCTCQPGWMGTLCEESVDDCVSSACLAGGQCIDKHLTYICQCPSIRTGVRCQYFSSSCTTTTVCGTNVCVPLVNKEENTCASNSTELVSLRLPKGRGAFDKEAFKARIIDTIASFYLRSAGSAATKNRVRRQASGEASVQIFIVQVREGSDGFMDVEFVVLDSSEQVFLETEVMAMLKQTCNEFEKENNDETVLCPAVSILSDDSEEKDQNKGPPLGIIIGAGAAVIVLVCIVVLVIVCKKRKQRETDKKMMK